MCRLVVDQGASVKTTTKLDSNCKPGAIKGRARHGNTPPVSFWSLRGVGAASTAAPPGAVAGADEEQQEAAANLGQFAAAQLHLKTNPSGDTILLNFWLALFGDCFGRRAKSPATAARRFLEGDSLTGRGRRGLHESWRTPYCPRCRRPKDRANQLQGHLGQIQGLEDARHDRRGAQDLPAKRRDCAQTLPFVQHSK